MNGIKMPHYKNLKERMISMKGNWKRKIVASIAALTMLASSMTFTAVADDSTSAQANSVTKIYADIKGIDIVFANAVTEADYEGLGFEKMGGDAVDFETAVEDKILHLHFDEEIETDTGYKLTIGDKEKSVVVNKLFFEDFEDLNPVVSNSKIEGYDEMGKKWSIGGTFAAIGESPMHGGTSKKAVFKDSSFGVSESLGTVEKTVTADVMVYNGATWNGGLTAKQADNSVKICTAGGTSNYVSSYAMNIYKNGVDVGVYDQSNKVDGYGYSMIKSTQKILKPASGLVVGSASAPSVGLETGYSNDDWKAANYTIDTVAEEYKYTARTYDNVISGYFGDEYIGTGLDRVTSTERYSETDRTSNVNTIYLERFAVNTNWPGFTAVDNVLVTSCTVADIVPNSVTKVYADTKGMDIVYENPVAANDYIDLAFVEVGGEAVEYTTEVEGNILHLHFNKDIKTGVAYRLTVDGENKAVTVKELFFEDFEDNALSTRADAGSISAKDRNGIEWKANQGNKFCAILDGAKYGDSGHWLAITDGPFHMNKNAGTADMSINADVMMYNGERRNNDNTGWVGYKTPTGQMFVRGAAYQESYTMKIANVGKDVQIGATSYKGTGSYGLMEGFKSIKADITFGSITAPSVRAENPSNEDWAAMTYTIDSLAKPYNYTARGYADTAAAYFENQYVGTYIDTVSGRFTDQRAGLQSNAAGTMLIDNVLVTTCTVEDIKEVEVTGIYADTAHVEIQFNEEISGNVIDASAISLKKYATDEVVALSAADFVAYGNTIRINKAIERDTLYEVSLKKGFGTTVNTASADFSEIFTVKTLWYHDFETTPEGGFANTVIRTGSTNVKEQPKAVNGKLVVKDAVAPIADELKNIENATLTTKMSIYKNLTRSEFASAYDKGVPYMYVAFNSTNSSISSGDLRWSSDNYGMRKFGWYFTNNSSRRFHNYANDLVVVTPAAGTDYKAGDIVSDKSSKGYGIVSPTAQTGTVDGIGTVDYGQHFKNANHNVFVAGDAYHNASTGEFTLYKKGETLPGSYTMGGNTVTTAQKDAETFELAIEKQGSTGSLVYNGTVVDTYATGEESMKTGYFGIAGTGLEIMAFDEMLVTAYVKTNTVREVTLDHADKHGVVIGGLKGEIPANFDGIVIYDINEKKNVAIKGGKSVDDSLFVDADLELNKPYKVTVKAKTAIGDDMYAGDDYTEVFMVKEVLKVEPTVESIKQLNKGIGGPVENKIVQGDGYVALFGMTLATPSYHNATIEADIAYYADVKNGAPYIVNFFNHAGKTVKYTNAAGTEDTSVGGFRLYISGKNNIRVNAANVIAEGEEYNDSNVPFFKKDVASGIYFGAYGCVRYDDPDNKDASSVWNGIIKAEDEVAPHTERYVMAEDAYRMYVDNNPILSYKGKMNDSGYVQFGGSSRGLSKFYGLTVTQMEIIDKIALNVEDITADAKEIKVLFDQNVQGASDFSKVEVLEDGVKVNATFEAVANELKLVPEGGMKSGAVYSVKVPAGFGPSEICYTSEDASKNFRVTIYADVDFADGADDAVTFDGVVNYIDGAAAFTNGSMVIDNAEMASASDYVVKYDYKHYAGLEIGGEYNIAPASKVWLNRAEVEAETGYSWSFGADSVVAKADNTDVATVSLTTKYGDALVKDSAITLYAKGESFGDYEIFIDDEIITESDRATVGYAFEVQKSDAGATLLRDGSLVHAFEVAASDTTGYFGITASDKDVIVIDNIQAYTFEEVTGIEVDIDVASGKAIVMNYGEEAVEMIVVVAAYNDNNGMISSFKSQTVTAGVGATEVPYTLEDTTGAKVYKAFCWNNLSDIAPYCKAAVYEVK